MEEHNTRLEYPIISKENVLYISLIFLSEYLDMQIAYRENERIDIIANDISNDISWRASIKNKRTIEIASIILKLNTDAETYWTKNPVLWNKYTEVG